MSSFDGIDVSLKVKKIDSEKKSTKSLDLLNQMVSKAPSFDNTVTTESQKDLHKQHFMQTIQQLKFIGKNIEMVDSSQVPEVSLPKSEKSKLLIFDMDETLLHCVDDIEKQETDVVIEINFPSEETVYAGINIRPYIIECI